MLSNHSRYGLEMIDFEERIMTSRIETLESINKDKFISKLHGRLSESHENRRTIKLSLCMFMIAIFMTITQFGAPTQEIEFYFDEDMRIFFDTDFLTIETDSLNFDRSYAIDVAFFLINEGYLWETIEFIGELEL